MKWTPAKQMTSALVFCACLRELERVADEVGDVLDLGLLVVVREEDARCARLSALISSASSSAASMGSPPPAF